MYYCSLNFISLCVCVCVCVICLGFACYGDDGVKLTPTELLMSVCK